MRSRIWKSIDSRSSVEIVRSCKLFIPQPICAVRPCIHFCSSPRTTITLYNPMSSYSLPYGYVDVYREAQVLQEGSTQLQQCLLGIDARLQAIENKLWPRNADGTGGAPQNPMVSLTSVQLPDDQRYPWTHSRITDYSMTSPWGPYHWQSWAH